MLKKLKWLVLGLVVAVGIVVAVVLINLNSIVRTAVETQSTASLGLETTLGGASISLVGGSVQLSDFKVASPQGFAAPSILELGGLGLDVSLGELRQDPVRVSAITLTRPTLTLEQKNLKLNLKAAADAMPRTAPAQSGPPKDPVKVVIGVVTVENPVVEILPGFPGLAQKITLNLPTLTVRDIGTADGNQNGVAIKQAVLTVATAIAQQAAQSDQLPPELRTLLSSDLSDLRNQLEGALRQKVEKALDDAKTKVEDAAKKATDDAKKKVEQGLGNFLGGNKDKK